MKRKLVALTVASILTTGAAALMPVAAFAASTNADASADTKDVDKDIDAKLADARARLEQAAHDVAELTGEKSRPLMDEFAVWTSDSFPRAIIGVQLDPHSGKDGARVQEVSPGGAAEEAGIRVGDVITGVDGTEVKGDGTARQVVHAMRKVKPDSKVTVKVLRDGKPKEFAVNARRGFMFAGMHEPPMPPIPPIPPLPPMPGEGGPRFNVFYGHELTHGPLGQMELATLTPQLGRYFGTEKGVLVVRAPKDFKLEDGDVIVAIDGREPTSGSHATRILGSYQSGEKVTMKLMRQQKSVTVQATMPDTMEPPPPGQRGPGPGEPGPGERGPGPGPGGHGGVDHRMHPMKDPNATT